MTTFDWVAILAVTLVMEVVTCYLRFNRGLSARRETQFLRRFTFGLRIHHGYVGLFMFAGFWFVPGESVVNVWILWIGAALFLSDVVHHFLVLWPIVGSPEFDLFYPKKQLSDRAA